MTTNNPSTFPNSNSAGKTSSPVTDDFRNVVNEAESLVKAIGSEGSAQVNDLKERLSTTMQSAKQKLEAMERDVAEYAKRAANNTNQYVQQNPWTSVGIGAAVGLFLGVLIGRR